ncbi:unnamed protein product [Penicillium glandicola]
MSLGFGVGDFISVLNLANKLRRDFVGAPSQFSSISREVRGLAIILQDVDNQLVGDCLDEVQQEQLREISHSCGILLKQLQDVIEKYQVLECCGTSTQKKARSIWKRISWDPKDIDELRVRLISNVTLLQSFLSVISSQTMAAAQETLEHINQRQESNEKSCILDWLSTVDYSLQQNDLLTRRQEGTGEWLLTSEEYKHWLRTRRAKLFCPGIPGAGKTICSAILVDDLNTRFEDKPDVGIAYIYCNFKRQEEQKAQDLLSSLLKQLSQKRSSLPDAVKDLYSRYKTTSRRPQFDEISKALQSVVSMYSDVFIVVDALDECEFTCRTRVLGEIMKIDVSAGAHVFATSRPTEINDLFKTGGLLEIRAHQDDVRRYLGGNMFKLPGFVRRSTALQEEIMTVISCHVQGMFLLAKLYFESLIGRRSAKSTRTALQELSRGVSDCAHDKAYDKAYDNAIDRIQGQLKEQTDLAMQTLSWLTYARRPLTSLELQHALAIEEGESSFDEENLPEIEDILAVCVGLVTVENERGIIRLVHYTTQEYLERKKDAFFPSAENRISMLCITYISFDIFGSGICETDEAFAERLESHPFYHYVVRHWGDHPKIDASEQASYVRMHSIPKDWTLQFPRHKMGLQLAASQGIEEAVSYFLQHQYPVDMCHNGGWTALQWAISRGYLGVTQLLLTHGADLKGNGELTDNPLATAAARGYGDIVRLLLGRGVDADTPCGLVGTALIAACDGGRLNTVEILLASGANINAESELYGSPLEAAAIGGHWRLVTLLLEKGANPNSQGNEIETALQAASESGREDVVQILLNYHADINRQGGIHGTALIAACVPGHEKIARMLLDNGANVNSEDGAHTSALIAASMNGNHRIVRMLLDRGANINAEHGRGTALITAVAKGQSHVAKMLLDNGADVNGRGKPHGTALHAAAAFGNGQMVQMLLDRGADSTVRAGIYKTPLRAAILRGHQEVASLLKSQREPSKV